LHVFLLRNVVNDCCHYSRHHYQEHFLNKRTSIDAVPNDWTFWIKLLLVIIVINNIWDLCRELINIISNLGNGSKIDLGSIFNDIVWIYIALVCLKYWFL